MNVPCKTCGAMILPTMAALTGGWCQPCQKDIRAEVDQASIAKAESNRNPDPFMVHMKELVARVFSTPEGFSRLSRTEQVYYAARQVVIIVGYRFLRAPLELIAGNTIFPVGLEGLREVGAADYRALVQRAVTLLAPDGKSTKQKQEEYSSHFTGQTKGPPPAWIGKFNNMVDELQKQSPGVEEMLREYAVREGLVDVAKG